MPSNSIGGDDRKQRAADCISGTLLVLLDSLRFMSGYHGISQLAIVSLAYANSNYDISATLSPTVRKWIVENRTKAGTAAERAMVAAGKIMWPSWFPKRKAEAKDAEKEFRVSLMPDGQHGLCFDVPGNACDLGVAGGGWSDGPGWELGGHNIFGPTQQLMLLAGLCTMVRLCREAQPS